MAINVHRQLLDYGKKLKLRSKTDVARGVAREQRCYSRGLYTR